MKKVAKRMVAILSVLVLVVTGSYYGDFQSVNASDGTNQNEWILFSSATGENFWKNNANGLEISKSDANVNLPSTALMENLVLKVKLQIGDEEALTSLKAGVLELAQETCDNSELCWELSRNELQVGMNWNLT